MDAQTSPSFAAGAKPKFINGKIVWAGGPSIKQHFALPEPIMYYIAKNPSTPEVYKKLVRSCKYFFEKMQILVVGNLYGNTKICLNEDCDGDERKEKCCFDIDFNKFSNKIWVTNNVCLDEENISTFSSLIFPKLFRWNNIQLHGFADNIMFDDFKKVASFLTDISFVGCRIINDDGNVVMLDKIFEITTNIKDFEFCFFNDFSMINAATMKNICKLKNLQNLEAFRLLFIPEIFNVEDLSNFIKNHQNTKICFSFNDGISEEYKVQVDALIDTVIESEVPNRLINYAGQNQEKEKIMKDCYQD
uniref:Uncharacterized protein n=1 Tax=Panagrolaimus superbus TaxID=310955 RepID=A0A914XWM4_9BILA